MDRRKTRTQQWLQSALIALLQEREYDTITIQEIADRADTARITFYRHYRDKDELLAAVVESLFQQLVEAAQPVLIVAVEQGEQEPPMLPLYRLVEQNHRMFSAILIGNASPLATRHLRQHLSSYILENINRVLPQGSSPFPRDLTAGHVAAALVGGLVWWLENERPYPTRYMAEASMWLIMFGFFGTSSVFPHLRPPEFPPLE